MDELYDKIHLVHLELKDRWRRKHLNKCSVCRDYFEHTLKCHLCHVKKLCYDCSFVKIVVCEQCHIDRRIVSMIKHNKNLNR